MSVKGIIMSLGMNNTRCERKILIIHDFENGFLPTYLPQWQCLAFKLQTSFQKSPILHRFEVDFKLSFPLEFSAPTELLLIWKWAQIFLVRVLWRTKSTRLRMKPKRYSYELRRPKIKRVEWCSTKSLWSFHEEKGNCSENDLKPYFK